MKYVKLNELKQELKKCNFSCFMSYYDHPGYVKCYFGHFGHDSELDQDCIKANRVLDKYRKELNLTQFDKSARYFIIRPSKR